LVKVLTDISPVEESTSFILNDLQSKFCISTGVGISCPLTERMMVTTEPLSVQVPEIAGSGGSQRIAPPEVEKAPLELKVRILSFSQGSQVAKSSSTGDVELA
jgi:hypothetical protein